MIGWRGRPHSEPWRTGGDAIMLGAPAAVSPLIYIKRIAAAAATIHEGVKRRRLAGTFSSVPRHSLHRHSQR